MFPPEVDKELAHIDRKWEAERERYLVTSRYSRRRYAPSAAAAAMMALITGGIGAFFFGLAFQGGNGGFFLLIGSTIVVAGLGISFRQYVRGRRYGAAHRAYLRRRAAAQDKLRD